MFFFLFLLKKNFNNDLLLFQDSMIVTLFSINQSSKSFERPQLIFVLTESIYKQLF